MSFGAVSTDDAKVSVVRSTSEDLGNKRWLSNILDVTAQWDDRVAIRQYNNS